MLTTQRKTTVTFVPSLIGLFLLLSSPVIAQQPASLQRTDSQNAGSKEMLREKAIPNVPVFTEFMGVRLGMSAGEVRKKLRQLKDKGDGQDFFILSDSQTAQVVYDDKGKVITISVDYTKASTAPSPESVIGEPVEAKADGSVYQLKRYREAGCWVAYSRTAGDNPIVTVTMQRM